MKKVLALALSLALAAGLATVAFAASEEGGTIEAKNDFVLGLSGGEVQLDIGDAETDTRNPDGNDIPGTKYIVDVVMVNTDGTTSNISKSDFKKSDADVYFKANKGSKYFEKAEVKYKSAKNAAGDTVSNAATYVQVKSKYPYLNKKDNEIEFKLGVKKGSNSTYYQYSGDIDNIFYDELGEDETDATINKVGTRIKVDDSGFSDIIQIDFDSDDEVLYEVKMYNKDEVVLYLDTDADKSLGTSFDDVDFDFFFFSQVGTFSSIGTLTIPGNEGDYVYELVTGTPSEVYATFGENEFLVPVDATWNSDEEALQFRTRNLGKYVVSSVQLDLSEWEDMADDTDVSIDDSDVEIDDGVSDIDDSDIEVDADPIPETGANGLANVAAVAGVIALAAAGAVAFKK